MRKTIFTVIICLFFIHKLSAQFTINENFKGNSVGNNIILGGEPTAFLTSGNADPVNNGWLRLTNDGENQKGYAYVNASFPSTMGVFIDFEYKTWRSRKDGSYNGADGISVFLFDATVPFKSGGFGGSLGYANHLTNPGLSGAYLGIGIDEYGNFATTGDNKTGGMADLQSNSIALRGSAANNWKYLTHKKLGATSSQDNEYSVDYNVTSTKRPTDNIFYRRVKIYIESIGTLLSPKYKIRVLWRTTPSGTDVELITYETTDPIPNSLKMGFAASTGGGFNYHEIRNLQITTPGGVRVSKQVDKENSLSNENLTYTINVHNETAGALSNLKMNDTIKLANGSISTLDDFEITGITFNNKGNAGTTVTGFTSGVTKTTALTNPSSFNINIAANSEASFTVVGKIKRIPNGGIIKNSVTIDPTPTGITDTDLTNNNATVATSVLNPNTDLKIEKLVDNYGIARQSGNQFSLIVSNMSTVVKPNGQQVTVTDNIPAGLTVTSVSAPGWTVTKSGNNYTFKRSDILNSMFTYPAILINVTPTIGGSWVNNANLTYTYDTNSTNNESSVQLRWMNYWYGGTSGKENDWAIKENWTANYVPLEYENIEFATIINNGAGLNGNGKGAAVSDLHLDKDRIIGDLINASDKNLLVTMGNSLRINNEVKDGDPNSGTIIVKADANNLKPSGTLIFSEPLKNSNVNAIVEFYNQAYDCATCGTYRRSWQYFGIPVQSAVFPFGDVSGTETINKWDEGFEGNKWQPETGSMLAFKGYQITNNSTTQPIGVYKFNGKLNIGNATVSVTKTENVNYSGANLISNSYTAAIPITTGVLTFPVGTEETVYLFNTGTRDQWRKLNGTAINQDGYRSGQYLAVPVGLGGQGNFPDRIPSMHSFMVLTNVSGNMQIDYSKLIKNTTVNRGDGMQIVTRSTENSNLTPQLPSMIVDVIGEKSADRVWLFTKDGSTHDFDNGWDGYKIEETGISQLYVRATDDSKLQVATVPDLNNVILGFVNDKDGKYTLEFSLTGKLKGIDIYLHDTVTGKTVKLQEGSNYNFESKKGESANRFIISYTEKNKFLSPEEALLEIVTTDKGTFRILNKSNKSCTATISDSRGNFIQRTEIDVNGDVLINSLSRGIYLIRLQNSEINYVRKISVE